MPKIALIMITKQHLSHITKWILIALLLLWIFAVTGVFYVVQKPFIPTDLAAWQQQNAPAFSFSAVALGRTLLDALTALWLWLIALGVGLWVYRWLAGQTDDSSAASNAGRKTNFPDKLEAIIFGSGLGFGAMGLLVFFLGLFIPKIGAE
jgi:small-conductance mechanosensitive channel